MKDNSASTETKISELLKEVRKKVNLSHHHDDLMKQQLVMIGLCADEERIAKPSTKCSFEGNESPGVPITMTEQEQENDEEIFKRLKIPWMLEGLSSTSERKCIDSENESLQRSIKQYRYQIEFLHETNEGLVVANRRLREDLEEVNSHYQELIAVSKEALKRKRKTQSLCVELKQTVQEITQQNKEL